MVILGVTDRNKVGAPALASSTQAKPAVSECARSEVALESTPGDCFAGTPGLYELGTLLQKAQALPSEQVKTSGHLSWSHYAFDGVKIQDLSKQLADVSSKFQRAGRTKEAEIVGRSATALTEVAKVQNIQFDDRVKLASVILDLRILHLGMVHPESATARDMDASLAYSALYDVRLTAATGRPYLSPTLSRIYLANAHAALLKLKTQINPAVSGGEQIVEAALKETRQFAGSNELRSCLRFTVVLLDAYLTRRQTIHNVKHPNEPLALYRVLTGDNADGLPRVVFNVRT